LGSFDVRQSTLALDVQGSCVGHDSLLIIIDTGVGSPMTTRPTCATDEDGGGSLLGANSATVPIAHRHITVRVTTGAHTSWRIAVSAHQYP